MGSGSYITYGVIVLVIVPILFAAIGQTFGVSVDGTTTVDGGSFLTGLALFVQGLQEVPFIGGVFAFLSNMFIGFALVPAWISIIAVTIPTILIIRGVASTSA